MNSLIVAAVLAASVYGAVALVHHNEVPLWQRWPTQADWLTVPERLHPAMEGCIRARLRHLGDIQSVVEFRPGYSFGGSAFEFCRSGLLPHRWGEQCDDGPCAFVGWCGYYHGKLMMKYDTIVVCESDYYGGGWVFAFECPTCQVPQVDGR